jgi:hypothetical protein
VLFRSLKPLPPTMFPSPSWERVRGNVAISLGLACGGIYVPALKPIRATTEGRPYRYSGQRGMALAASQNGGFLRKCHSEFAFGE